VELLVAVCCAAMGLALAVQSAVLGAIVREVLAISNHPATTRRRNVASAFHRTSTVASSAGSGS
jgi:hypothetical protein